MYNTEEKGLEQNKHTNKTYIVAMKKHHFIKAIPYPLCLLRGESERVLSATE